VTREIWDALTIWAPRIGLQKVTVAMTEFSRFSTSVFWRPIESVLDDLRVTEVTYNG
jgi:phage baseplate assembly protein W